MLAHFQFQLSVYVTGVDWYYCEKLNEAVHRYHEQHARHSPQFEQAGRLHLRVLEEIRKYFSDGPKILHHTMEPIEDGDITGDRAKYGLEFRVHFIMVSTVVADYFLNQVINQ